MRRWLIAAALAWLALGSAQAKDAPAASATEQDKSLSSLPQGRGLPVVVRAGLSFIELKEINENEGTFTATVDTRQRWQDVRLAFPVEQAAAGYHEFLDGEVEKKLAQIWHPNVEFSNLKAAPTFQKRNLRISPDGRVELMQRTTAAFESDYSLENFPFDRQKLGVEMISRSEPLERLLLDYRQDELEFSNTQHGATLDGWTVGLVELSKDAVQAWRGEANTRVKAALVVKRQQKSLLATIFVPLFASLLIPLLVLWLNKIENGEFAIDAFELTNISIGGLFAVVALNFTVNSSFVKLATGDNPVMRLFGLNYFLLAVSFAVGILLYRYSGVKRLFGTHVQQEFYAFINWAIPVLVFGTATAMVLMAVF